MSQREKVGKDAYLPGFTCGVKRKYTGHTIETANKHNLIDAWKLNIIDGGFNFMVLPLSFLEDDAVVLAVKELHGLEANDDGISCPWLQSIVGKINTWIDLDSPDDIFATICKHLLGHQIDRCSDLNLKLWLRIPFVDQSSSSSYDLDAFWRTWNSFHQLCDHHSKLSTALEISRVLPPENLQNRWYRQPVAAAILDSSIFSTMTHGIGSNNSKQLPQGHQKLVSNLFNNYVQIIIWDQVQPKAALEDDVYPHSAAGSETHPLRPYLDHIVCLYKQELTPTQQEGPEYERAICQALVDRVPEEEASVITTKILVDGADITLVLASVQAASKTKRNVRVYVAERAANSDDALALWVLDMYPGYFISRESIDILVSRLRSSFCGNDLPLQWAENKKFLKKDGISIPTLYTSSVQPVTASTLYDKAKEDNDISNFETASEEKRHSVAPLAKCQQIFIHPTYLDEERDRQFKKLNFVIPDDTGSATVHGFAAYFEATLYKDVKVGVQPSTTNPDSFTWFPLRTSICVDGGSTLELQFMQRHDLEKVWYEWRVASPIHNIMGRSFSLDAM